MKSKLINVLQGKTARWVEGITNADGLYTDEITTCKIFILYGTKDGKNAISMTHFDGYRNIQQLVETEKAWFSQVNNLYIYYKPERQNSENLSHFNEKIEALDIKCEKCKLPETCDAVTAKPQEKIDFLISDKFEQNNIVLINHDKADEIYAFYKINVTFSGIEGYLKFGLLYRKGEVTKASSRNCTYNNETRSIADWRDKLATPIEQQELMFDGEHFLDPKKHDISLSEFANLIVSKFDKDHTGFRKIAQMRNCLAEVLTKYEKQLFQAYKEHNVSDWYNDEQTFCIVANYSYIKNIQYEISSDKHINYVDHFRVIQKYTNEFNQKREKELDSASSSKTSKGSPTTVSGEKHTELVKRLKKITNSNLSYFKPFSDYIDERQYTKALRTACRNISANKHTFDLIKILLSYKQPLSINIDEQVGQDNFAAIHYAATQGHQELYDYLVQQGANVQVSDAKGISAERYMLQAKPTETLTKKQ